MTKDVNIAEEMAKELESGMTFINQITMSLFDLPTGGVKNSGFGREMGKDGVTEFSNSKVIWIDNHYN